MYFPHHTFITLKPGFDLFHVSNRNMGLEYDYSDPESVYDFGTTPIGSLDMENSLKNSKYFGLTEVFPYVKELENDPSRGLSKYVTSNNITLAVLEVMNHPNKEFMEHLKGTCNGWLRYDEWNSLWYELYLFEPWKYVNKGVEVIPNVSAVQYLDYPLNYRLYELQKLLHYKL